MKRPQAAQELLPKMQTSGEYPDLPTYSVLLNGLFKNKFFSEAMELYQEMEDKKMCLTIRIYNILIDGMCTNGKLMTARRLFYSLATKGGWVGNGWQPG